MAILRWYIYIGKVSLREYSSVLVFHGSDSLLVLGHNLK